MMKVERRTYTVLQTPHKGPLSFSRQISPPKEIESIPYRIILPGVMNLYTGISRVLSSFCPIKELNE